MSVFANWDVEVPDQAICVPSGAFRGFQMIGSRLRKTVYTKSQDNNSSRFCMK